MFAQGARPGPDRDIVCLGGARSHDHVYSTKSREARPLPPDALLIRESNSTPGLVCHRLESCWAAVRVARVRTGRWQRYLHSVRQSRLGSVLPLNVEQTELTSHILRSHEYATAAGGRGVLFARHEVARGAETSVRLPGETRVARERGQEVPSARRTLAFWVLAAVFSGACCGH